MTTEHEGVMKAQHFALGFLRPPARGIAIDSARGQAAAHTVIGTVECEGDVRGVEEKDYRVQQWDCPIADDTHQQDCQVAHDDASRQVVGLQQGGVAPAEEHGTDVEVADRECRGGGRPRRAPAVMGMEQEADGEGKIYYCGELARAVIDLVVTIPIVVMQQHEGNHQVDDCTDEQCGIVELLFHDAKTNSATKVRNKCQCGGDKNDNGMTKTQILGKLV